MKNKKINTLIAIAVTLGVVWMWNEGVFGVTAPEDEYMMGASGTMLTEDERYMSPEFYDGTDNIELQ